MPHIAAACLALSSLQATDSQGQGCRLTQWPLGSWAICASGNSAPAGRIQFILLSLDEARPLGVSLTVLTCLGNLGVSQNTIHYWHLLCGHLSLGGRWALNQSREAGLSPAVPCRLLTPRLSHLQGSILPGPTWRRARRFCSGFYLSFKSTDVRFLLCASRKLLAPVSRE